jgi:hypothetical protein
LENRTGLKPGDGSIPLPFRFVYGGRMEEAPRIFANGMELRENPYWIDRDFICPLIDGTDLICKNAYPISCHFSGLDHSSDEEVTIQINTRYDK